MDREFWLNAREDDPSAPKIRIKINYDQDEMQKYFNEVEIWDNEIRQDVGLLTQVRAFIVQLRNPFGFLRYDID